MTAFFSTYLRSKEMGVHSGLPSINFVFEIKIPKKGSTSKYFIKQTIYQWFQVPAPNIQLFLAIFDIFLDFSRVFPYDFMEFNLSKAYEACICL